MSTTNPDRRLVVLRHRKGIPHKFGTYYTTGILRDIREGRMKR